MTPPRTIDGLTLQDWKQIADQYANTPDWSCMSKLRELALRKVAEFDQVSA